MPTLKLIDAPRLYVRADVADNLKDKLHSPYLQKTAEAVLRDADYLVRARPIREDESERYQPATRAIDSQMQCLTVAWVLTRNATYRKAACKHLGNLLNWNHISCEANHTIPAERELPFCLSYGEHAATIGLMYDLFRPDMSEEEKALFFAVVDRFCMKEAVKCLSRPPWWAFKEWSNWNGVCAGGIGIMALAFYTDHPDAPELIPFVEKSLGEYFKSYVKNGGGCHEGTGYWNYGMNYAMRYVLSWENATGKKHPALGIKELKKSLQFPLDFAGISFGDNDGWGPSCFFFMLADRLKQKDAALAADAYLSMPPATKPKTRERLARVNRGEILFAADCIPTVDERARLRAAHTEKKVPVARVYDGLDWAALADDTAIPRLRMSVRGGSSSVAGHGMLDLLSIRCRINGQLMITDQQDGGYLPTTFTGRGSDLYGRSIASKSSFFVDGLGCAPNVACDKTEAVKGKDIVGIRVDGSHIFIPRWKNACIARLCLLVENSYWLVIDHAKFAGEVNNHWAESRFHTLAVSRHGKDWVSLTSGPEKMMLTFAALGPGALQTSLGMPSNYGPKQTTIFRWMGTAESNDNLHVVAMNPGTKKLSLALTKETGRRGYTIAVTGQDGYQRDIRISPTLKLRNSTD